MVTLPITPGCGLIIKKRGGPSNVSQGLLYEAGEITYDEFFRSLHQHQVKLADAPDQEKRIRQRLAKRLGVDDDSSSSLLAKAAGKHAERLAEAGIILRMKVEGLDEEEGEEPTAVLELGGDEPAAEDKKIIRAIDRAAKQAADLIAEMRQSKEEIGKLGEQAVTLDAGVDATFGTRAGKGSEVRQNLQDAQRLIPLMVTRSEEVAEAAESVLAQIANVANTADKPATKPAQQPPEPDAGAAPPAAPPPAGPRAPSPKGAPPKAESGGDQFEP
jgi:hypothetical protein